MSVGWKRTEWDQCSRYLDIKWKDVNWMAHLARNDAHEPWYTQQATFYGLLHEWRIRLEHGHAGNVREKIRRTCIEFINEIELYNDGGSGLFREAKLGWSRIYTQDRVELTSSKVTTWNTYMLIQTRPPKRIRIHHTHRNWPNKGKGPVRAWIWKIGKTLTMNWFVRIVHRWSA